MDRGINLLKPQYEARMLVAADTAYWEVLYADGSVLCEARGARYPQIDRSALRSFRVIRNGENVFEMFPPPGRNGHDLVYRRRSTISVGDNAGRTVAIILGWAPMGPMYLLDLDSGQYYEDTEGLMPTLEPMPGEPDDLLQKENT